MTIRPQVKHGLTWKTSTVITQDFKHALTEKVVNSIRYEFQSLWCQQAFKAPWFMAQCIGGDRHPAGSIKC